MAIERFKGGAGETVQSLARDAKPTPKDKNKALATVRSELLRALLLAKDLDKDAE